MKKREKKRQRLNRLTGKRLTKMKDLLFFVNTSHPVVYLLVFLAIYSLIINYIFGHKTFWRYYPSYIFSKCNKLVHEIFGLSRHHEVRISSSHQFTFQALNDDLIIRCLSFISPCDLLEVGTTCKQMYTYSEHSFLWQQLQKLMITSTNEITKDKPYADISFSSFRLVRWSLSEKRFTFCLYSVLISHILAISLGSDEACYIKVNGNIFDLTIFQNEHPGGIEVLRNWKGKDASKPFHVAHHSLFALNLSVNYLIWSRKEILGR
jgi:cytochrome b involved in lipid metabolism